MKKIYFIVGHVSEIVGPGHHLRDFLASLPNSDTFMIFQPMPGSKLSESVIYRYTNKRTRKLIHKYDAHPGFFFRLFFDTLVTIQQIIRTPGKIDVYIGLNNFDTLPSILFKGWKIKKIIYYGSDYSDVRFTNPILNAFYRFVELVILKFCDLSVSNTNRAMARRKTLGLNLRKAIMIPNGVDLAKIPKSRKIPVYKFIYQGYLSRTHGIFEALDSLKELVREYPKIKLALVGVGPDINEIKQYILQNNLKENVNFVGKLSHTNMLKFLLEKCQVGIASYTNSAPWVKYGSSLKVKEYLACGLAVIVSDIPEIAQDISSQHMGLVYSNKRGLYNAMKRFCVDKSFAKVCTNNARKYIVDFDWQKMYKLYLAPHMI